MEKIYKMRDDDRILIMKEVKNTIPADRQADVLKNLIFIAEQIRQAIPPDNPDRFNYVRYSALQRLMQKLKKEYPQFSAIPEDNVDKVKLRELTSEVTKDFQKMERRFSQMFRERKEVPTPAAPRVAAESYRPRN